MEIEEAVETSDAVIVFLSNTSISKEGYIQRELKFVLDIAFEKPDETIFSNFQYGWIIVFCLEDYAHCNT